MDFEALIPISMFVCIFLAIKAVVDARARKAMLQSGNNEDLLRALIEGEERRRQNAALRWGVVLLALGGGFAIIQAAQWNEPNAGAFSVLLFALGLGNLVSWVVARKVK